MKEKCGCLLGGGQLGDSKGKESHISLFNGSKISLISFLALKQTNMLFVQLTLCL